MEAFYGFIDNLSGFIWGGSWGSTQILPFAPLAVFLLGSGLFFMIRLGGRPLRRFGPALAELWGSRKMRSRLSNLGPPPAINSQGASSLRPRASRW